MHDLWEQPHAVRQRVTKTSGRQVCTRGARDKQDRQKRGTRFKPHSPFRKDRLVAGQVIRAVYYVRSVPVPRNRSMLSVYDGSAQVRRGLP